MASDALPHIACTTSKAVHQVLEAMGSMQGVARPTPNMAAYFPLQLARGSAAHLPLAAVTYFDCPDVCSAAIAPHGNAEALLYSMCIELQSTPFSHSTALREYNMNTRQRSMSAAQHSAAYLRLACIKAQGR